MSQSSAQAPLLLQEFTSLAILAYECGYDECTVKEEMSTSPLEVCPDCPLWTSGSGFSGIAGSVQGLSCDECLVYTCVAWTFPATFQERHGSVQGLNHDECLLYTCVVWITLVLAPSRPVIRWATKGVTLQAIRSCHCRAILAHRRRVLHIPVILQHCGRGRQLHYYFGVCEKGLNTALTPHGHAMQEMQSQTALCCYGRAS